jgi:hypothetical protein
VNATASGSCPVAGFGDSGIEYSASNIKECRSKWPRGLKHEPSSLAITLGSWVSIPLKAWMSGCVYSVCVLFYV